MRSQGAEKRLLTGAGGYSDIHTPPSYTCSCLYSFNIYHSCDLLIAPICLLPSHLARQLASPGVLGVVAMTSRRFSSYPKRTGSQTPSSATWISASLGSTADTEGGGGELILSNASKRRGVRTTQDGLDSHHRRRF